MIEEKIAEAESSKAKTRQICIRMHHNDYIDLKEMSHDLYKSMARTIYDAIRIHVDKHKGKEKK